MMSKDMTMNSIDELIASLEPVDRSEISSDIRANVNAELKRIRRNVSLILSFTSNPAIFESGADVELQKTVTKLRQDCFLVNGTVGKMLVLNILRLGLWADYPTQIAEQYAEMAASAQRLCKLFNPVLVPQLANALS